MDIEWTFAIPIVSGGGQPFQCFLGLFTSPSGGGDPVNGVYVRCETNATFTFVVRSGGVDLLATPTGVTAVAGITYRFRIKVDGRDLSLEYATGRGASSSPYVSLVSEPISVLLPLVATPLGIGAKINKNSSSGPRTLRIDRIIINTENN
jgi:hypothetical protein